jgi:hypothetical protein
VVYWQARIIGNPGASLVKAYLSEERIVQRMPSGELKIVILMNADDSFLPDSAPPRDLTRRLRVPAPGSTLRW